MLARSEITQKPSITPVRTIRLYRYELEALPEYSCTMPTDKTDWKMWRCNESFGTRRPDSWIVAQYVPLAEEPTKIGVRVFSIEFLEGPAPLCWTGWTKIGPRLWAAFEHDIRRGHDVRKFHAVQIFVGDGHPDKTGAEEFVRVTREASYSVFRGLCDIVQAMSRSYGPLEEKKLEKIEKLKQEIEQQNESFNELADLFGIEGKRRTPENVIKCTKSALNQLQRAGGGDVS
jgi:hypothetical protein